jgi:elongation factor Ts
MEISAKVVNELRQKTGAGMMDCKRALQETQGDLDKALTYLREKGIASASKKAARVAAEGKVESYLHMGGKIGVLIEVNCETDFVARGEDFQTFCRELAMQVAAANPQYLTREEVPPAVIDQEKAIYRKQVIESGKPEKVADKIVEGRMNKYFSEFCLLDQAYIRDQDKTIDQLRKELVAKTKENVSIRRFARFVLGEGIEKRKSDLAAEVAEQLQQGAQK